MITDTRSPFRRKIGSSDSIRVVLPEPDQPQIAIQRLLRPW
ncbi:MAG: hypothetical protein ORO03_08475 [Alphaproteobacteria bacterium]|nr:hypothetical protein [Alphaproteobacteria bacterium]